MIHSHAIPQGAHPHERSICGIFSHLTLHRSFPQKQSKVSEMSQFGFPMYIFVRLLLHTEFQQAAEAGGGKHGESYAAPDDTR